MSSCPREPVTLDDMVAAASAQVALPVERWHPERCGHSGMRIAADGTWYHDSHPIKRLELVRLFARILRREADGRYVLVTPAEKLDIAVEDAPLIAVEMASEGDRFARKIAFRLNTDEIVPLGPDHPLRMAGERPYLGVRGGIEARVERAVYYELAEIALAEDANGVWSDGAFFALVTP